MSSTRIHPGTDEGRDFVQASGKKFPVSDPKSKLPPVVVWRNAIDASTLPAPTRAVLRNLASHMDKDGGSCFPGIDLQAERTGYSRRSVTRHLDLADREGWIARLKGGGTDRNGNGIPTHYFATLPEPVAQEQQGHCVEQQGHCVEQQGQSDPGAVQLVVQRAEKEETPPNGGGKKKTGGGAREHKTSEPKPGTEERGSDPSSMPQPGSESARPETQKPTPAQVRHELEARGYSAEAIDAGIDQIRLTGVSVVRHPIRYAAQVAERFEADQARRRKEHEHARAVQEEYERERREVEAYRCDHGRRTQAAGAEREKCAECADESAVWFAQVKRDRWKAEEANRLRQQKRAEHNAFRCDHGLHTRAAGAERESCAECGATSREASNWRKHLPEYQRSA